MSNVLDEPETFTFVELQQQLGGVPAHRILLRPTPGTATEADVMRLLDQRGVRCELIDGTLVEKEMDWKESVIASRINRKIGIYLATNDCGETSGEQGGIRLILGRIRFPDLAFYRYERFPNGEFPTEAFPNLAPDLAVEVLSESNTASEMELKRKEYFLAGTQLVWEIDPESRSVEVFASSEESTLLDSEGTLDGGKVLPGFTMAIGELFAKPQTRA